MTTSTETTPPVIEYTPTLRDYFAVIAVLSIFGAVLAWVVLRSSGGPSPDSILGPIVALAALTGLVWLTMVIARNYAILRRMASAEYYVDYDAGKSPAADWVERPARTFNNLLQVPVLFYVVCLAMLSTGRLDAAQLSLAWIFVGARAVHALVYIGWNRGPYRFTAWMAGCITLVVIFVRFALDIGSM